jgi:uncharacterized protein YjbI with pentapeptide repeats
MKVIKPQRLGLLTRSYEFGRDCLLSVAIVLFFPLDDPRKLLSEVNLWKFAPGELGATTLDDCMPKARAEFLVKGSAYTAEGRPAVACAPRVQLGNLAKTLRVTGNRQWQSGAPTAPEPFTMMPLTWENAFGGPDYKQNPLGKGIAKVPTDRGEVQPLPNVEDPGRLMRSPEDRPPPAGFGPYDLMWPQRFDKAGTHDAKWLEERFPGFAADIDWTMFNAAPGDQQVEGPFRGDEAFALESMHPTKARIEGKLPGACARCFVNVKSDGGEDFREVATRLDTVWFFPHAERGILVLHGVMKVAEDDASDVLQIVAACEEMGAPRPVEHYRRVLAERLDKEKGAVAAMRDGDLMPAWPGAADGPDASEMQAILSENLLRKNQRKRVEREIERERGRILALGLDPAKYPLPSLPPEEPEPSVEQAFAMVTQARSEAEAQRKVMEQEGARREEELRRSLAAQGLDPDEAMERLRRSQGGPPKFSAEGALQELRDLAEMGRRHGQDVSALVSMASDPSYRRRLEEAEKRIREGYRFSAHEGPPGPELDAATSARVRAAVLEAIRAGESFEGRDLTGADLSGLEAPGANLSGAFMEGVNLAGADLSGADLSGAVLARADLSKANLRGARLARANLGASRLVEAQVADADLREAVLSKADLAGADFQGAQLEKAKLFEVALAGANLSRVHAPQVVFMKTDLSGMRFCGADLTKCTFLEVTAEGADFSGARLESASFLGARGRGALFRGAHLQKMVMVQECTFEESDFTGADLTGANLRGSKLAGCDFSRARLSGADLSECDLRLCRFEGAVAREARFVKADLGEAVLAGANLMGAVMQKAKLPGADLAGASLYQADMSRVLSDERTKVVGANMKKVRLDPKRVR